MPAHWDVQMSQIRGDGGAASANNARRGSKRQISMNQEAVFSRVQSPASQALC